MPLLAHRALPLAAVALALAMAAPARAQLGLDLGSPEKKEKEQPKKKAKAKPKAKPKPAARPREKAPSRPAVRAPEPAAPRPERPPAPAAAPAPAEEKLLAPAPPAGPAPAVPLPPPPRPAEKPARPPAIEGLTVSGKGAGRQRLEAAKRLLDDGSLDTAAMAYHEILRDGSLAADHDEARYQLAKSLLRMKLHYASLARFDEILRRGASGTKYFYNALDGLFSVGKRIARERRDASEGRGQEQAILSYVARFAGERLPPEYQDRFNYLLSRYHFERGRALAEAGQGGEARRSYDEARRLSALVRPGAGTMPTGGDPVDSDDEENLHARARFIDGAVLFAQGDKEGSLEAFKEVIRLTNPRRTRRDDPKLREAAFLQLARIHYEHRQNRYAIFYYSKMPWGEPLWLEGLWESSYAYYRIGDYEKALGNLLTLHSPYFQDEYFPESHILKAIIYFENCRYPEARAILEDFNRRYEPVYAELKALTAARPGTSAAFYERIGAGARAEARGEQASITRKILNIALTDRTIRRLDDTLKDIDQELDQKVPGRRDAFRTSALSAEILSQLKGQKTALLEEAGARARQKLEFERDALRELLEQGLRIKIEVSRKEREALESSLAAGGQVDVMRRYRFSAAVSDEHEYWPYEGEFWRDELGTYSYTLTKGCREVRPTRAEAR